MIMKISIKNCRSIIKLLHLHTSSQSLQESKESDGERGGEENSGRESGKKTEGEGRESKSIIIQSSTTTYSQ